MEYLHEQQDLKSSQEPSSSSSSPSSSSSTPPPRSSSTTQGGGSVKLQRRNTPVEAFLGDLSDVPAAGIVDDKDEDPDRCDDFRIRRSRKSSMTSDNNNNNKAETVHDDKSLVATSTSQQVVSQNDTSSSPTSTSTSTSHREPIDHGLQMAVNMGCGALSGISATLIIYPIDVIRRRMQLQGLHRTKEARHGALTEARLIISKEGVKGMYRGLTPELCKIIPMVSITFCVYESLKEYLGVDANREQHEK
jgi:hypothetical protein